MNILGIETSCDDTSVALVNASDAGFDILSEKTASQVAIHKKYGGVVPEVAGRAHAENVLPVVEEVMSEQEKPDAIAVTSGPGLITGLLVGVEAAKTLSYLWDIPIIGVNHIEGHIHSVLLEDQPPSNSPLSKGGQRGIRFPALCLIVSGGHTELILMNDFGEYELVGKTRDDAVGECFDKVGKLLELEYPGGPKISKLATDGDATAIDFPRPMLDSDNFYFSFSGLKTAALYWLQDNDLTKATPSDVEGSHDKQRDSSTSLRSAQNDTTASKEDFCASFQQAIVDVLGTKTARAIETTKAKTLLLGGGVSANEALRKRLKEIAEEKHVMLKIPNLKYAMDNAAMIAAAAFHRTKKQDLVDWRKLTAEPNWKVYH